MCEQRTPQAERIIMTQLITAVRYGDSLTIITHVFSNPEDKSSEGEKTVPQFPLFVISENQTKEEFAESFKESMKAHPAQDMLDMYIIQRGSSLYFGLNQVRQRFIAAVKDTFGWTQDLDIEYPVSEQFSYQHELVAFPYPLVTPEQIVTNILVGELFPSKMSLELYNDHVTQMRSLKQ